MVDRSVLAANLISGAPWLALLALLTSWVLAAIGAAYVVVVSVFFAAVYRREGLSRRHEALAWIAPWLLAVALWTAIAAGIDPGHGSLLLLVWFGLILGTGCYLAWQLTSLIARQLISWRRETSR